MFYRTKIRKSVILNNVFNLLFLFSILLAPCITKANIIINGSLAQEYQAIPGESYTGQIGVKNTGKDEVEVKIYQTDYRFYANGENFYDEPGTIQRSNANWIKFSPQIFTMQGKSERIVYYTVTVPHNNQQDNSALSGTYWSLLMIESLPVSKIEQSKEKNQLGVSSIMRYAMQVITHIGTDTNKNLFFSSSKLLKDKENLYLQFDIENTCEHLLKPNVRLELYNSNGQAVGNFSAEPKRTFPGTSVRHGIKLDNITNGNYQALIIADCGAEDLFGHQLTLDIK
jgi:hypothetical protein